MKNITLKLFVAVLIVFLSSCTHDYIEYPTVKGRELMLSRENVRVAKYSKAIVEIISGVGSYTVSKKDDSKVGVKLIGKKIYIEALEKGITDIVVVDNETNIEKKISVRIDEINFDEVVLVEKGAFKFGTLQIDFISDFKIGRYEVTVKQFCEFLNSDKSNSYRETWSKYSPINFPNINFKKNKYIPVVGKTDLPVVGITWEMARDYCESKGGRLPSETEWEYAAQGGKFGPGHGNEKMSYQYLNTVAWWGGNSAWDILYDVQTKVKNALGINNMLGNASEWCMDNVRYYEDIPSDGTPYVNGNEYHIVRGGSTSFHDPVYYTIHETRVKSNWCSRSVGFRIAYDYIAD